MFCFGADLVRGKPKRQAPCRSARRIPVAGHHHARRARQRDRLTSTVPVPGVQRLDCERPATGHGFGVGRHCQRAGFSSDYLGMGVTATIFPEEDPITKRPMPDRIAPARSGGGLNAGKAVNFYLNPKKVAGRDWPASPYQVLEFCMSYVPCAPIASPGDSHGSGEPFPGRERQPRHRKSENPDNSGS